ncbi:hypothetical protein [Jatrophihabitans endophyticus]|uniref:hypothetical protein n=1 Tax=Jatrophihabitans endophyticus TaxID=1206085 RepID=UPI001160E6EE|nr:hypothetical protein [Jatrophihabitans endophyticus]
MTDPRSITPDDGHGAVERSDGAALRTAFDNPSVVLTMPWPHDPIPEIDLGPRRGAGRRAAVHRAVRAGHRGPGGIHHHQKNRERHHGTDKWSTTSVCRADVAVIR